MMMLSSTLATSSLRPTRCAPTFSVAHCVPERVSAPFAHASCCCLLQVDLTSNVTKNIPLRVPIVSSPMDTVTEAEMAITMATLGGMGFIHYNNTAEEQLRQVLKAKRHTPGFIVTPAVAGPNDTVSKLYELKVGSQLKCVYTCSCAGAWAHESKRACRVGPQGIAAQPLVPVVCVSLDPPSASIRSTHTTQTPSPSSNPRTPAASPPCV